MAVDAVRAKSLFLAASDLPEAERAAYLDRECGGDADLRARVEELLRADAGAPPTDPDRTGTLGPAADEPGADEGMADHAPELDAGAVVAGRYKLVELIGEGGMGSVWMAQQVEPVRRAVAVKLIKAGMDSKQVLARFEAERQALALMDHPNIARVLDAGLPDGRPFFVMELVKGVPITEFCDARRLTPRQRLELFVPVCQAIQHAHQKGVIHRDVKPSNVLVALYDGRPVPKVIDFGIAKAAGQPLTERTLMTGFGAVVGTPEYMSPEQASFNQLDIDTRSDVYALGVLLYELLTGSPPHPRKDLERAGLLEILRVIREVEPPRPSTRLSSSQALAGIAEVRGTEPARLARLVRGELDWIVMRALEKDRSRRYESASAFAADVQRYLAGEAVQAVPPSAGYRLRMFARRNRGPLAAAAVVFAALVAGIVGTSVGLMQAVDAQKRADDARGAAEANEKKAVEAGELLQDARDKLWASLHASRAALIQSNWDAGKYDRVRELLAEQVPAAGQRDLRGFEWHFIDRQVNGDLWTVVVPPNEAGFAPLSPDGTRLLRLTENRDRKLLRSFDTATGREVLALPVPPQSAVRVGWSGDGKWVVATVHDQSGLVPQIGTADVRRWDAVTGAEAPPLRGVATVGGVLPGGGPVAAAWAQRTKDDPGPAYRYWDGTAVKRVGLPPAEWDEVAVLAISPDGSVLAATGRKGKAVVELLETRTGKSLARAGDPDIPLGRAMHELDAGAVELSPDGKRLAVSGATLTLWEVNPRRKLVEIKARFARAAFSPDGTRLAYTDGPDAKIADPATGRVRRVLKGHEGGIDSLAFTRDGTALLTAGGGRVTHWDATLDEGVRAVPYRHDEVRPEFSYPSPDGRLAGRFEDPEIKVWGAADDSPVVHKVSPPEHRVERDRSRQTGPEMPGLCTFSPDGRRVAAVYAAAYGGRDDDSWVSTIYLWDLAARRQLMAFERRGMLTARAFSPDGRLLAALFDPPGEVMVWDAVTGRHRHTLKLPRGRNFVLAFSTDGSRMVAIGGDGDTLAVRSWDPATGEPILCANVPYGTEKGRPRMGWLPPAVGPGGGRVAAFVRFGAISVWDTETGGRLVELKGARGLAQATTLVAFSPDGRRLATCGQRGEVKLWDPGTGTELLSLQVPAEVVHHLDFTPDGHRIRLVAHTAAGFETRLLDGSPRPGVK